VEGIARRGCEVELQQRGFFGWGEMGLFPIFHPFTVKTDWDGEL